MSDEKPARIRLGMVGGGKDAFIGGVHRIAARIDDQFELVAGALCSTPEKRPRESARALGLAEDRTYDDFTTMAKREARRKNGIEAVAIVTPNHMHAPAAREFLKRGIHVICDKPLTATLPEAKKLAKAAAESDALFILTHNYTGYPMVRQARAMVADGTLGTHPGGAGRVRPGLAGDAGRGERAEAGRLAHRPGALGQGRLDRRHRHPRLQPGELRHRAEARGARRRPAGLRAGPAGRRQRPRAAALRGRRARHALVQPGGDGQRERAAAPGLRRQGRPGVGAGGSELPLVHPARRAEAAADPRRRRRGAGGGAGQPHARAATPRATSRASPTSTPRRRGRSSRGAKASRCRPTWSIRRSRTASPASRSSMPACARRSGTAAWVRL